MSLSDNAVMRPLMFVVILVDLHKTGTGWPKTRLAFW
jgi:hypothetical protein